MRRAFLLSALAFVLAACGGAGGLTKAQYDTKVSRLCLLAADRSRELHIDNSVAAWRHDGPSVVLIAQRFNNSLAALKAPGEIAAAAAAFLKANKKLLVDYQAAVAAAKAGDRARLQAIGQQSIRDGNATFAPARAIGARSCYL